MTETITDAEAGRLLALAGAGDRAAFDRLFAAHRPALRRAVAAHMGQRLRARVDPSDVVQDAGLVAFRRLPDFLARRPMPFGLWLWRTAADRLASAARHHLAAGRRAVAREEPSADRPAADPSPSQQSMAAERAARVRAVVAGLPDADRQILTLRNLDELSNLAAAAALGVDPATASRRYGRAVLRLRAALLDIGLTGSDA